MTVVRAALIPLLIGFAVPSPAPAQEPKAPAAPTAEPKEEVLSKPLDDRRDLTLLEKVSDRTFVHRAARVAYTVPEGWKEIRPHRLARKIDPRISTVLGIETGRDRDLVASLYWIQMNPGQQLADWARTEAIRGEYGEEYETLKAVYGKDKVTIPRRVAYGPFEVYRIDITGGPDRGERYDGALMVFSVDSGGVRWLLKARLSYPHAARAQADQFVREVMDGYSRLPESGGKKGPEAEATVPEKETGKQ